MFSPNANYIDVGPSLSRWQQRKYERERLKDYLSSVRAIHGAIQFLGLPSLKDNPDVPIDRLFVEPSISETYFRPDMPLRNWPKTNQLAETLAESKRLVILGDPGTGKSTIANWLSYQLADAQMNSWKAMLGSAIPIPMILRDLGVSRSLTWEDLLKTFLTKPLGKHLSLEQLNKILANGHAFVILDGLDEIGDHRSRSNLRSVVHAGIKEYPNCHWLMTSRIVGYDSVAFHVAQHDFDRDTKHWQVGIEFAAKNAPAVLRYVAPFDDDQIKQFATNWHVEREATLHQAIVNAENLESAIHRDTGTLRLARIPNLLAIMALVHRIRAFLPNGKALLYDDISKAYLETIDEYRKIREDSDSLRDKRRWLGRVGFEMQQRRTGTNLVQKESQDAVVDEESIKRWLKDAMQQGKAAVHEEDAGAFLDRIQRRSGLMIERAPKQFAFTHLSFQEYFAAVFLKEQIVTPNWIGGEDLFPGTSSEELRKYTCNPYWLETFVYLFELIADETPAWRKLIREKIWGDDWNATLPIEEKNKEVPSLLLARLIADQHIGWEQYVRDSAMSQCVKWLAQSQQDDEVGHDTTQAIVTQILMTDDVQEQTKTLEIIATVFGNVGGNTLWLTNLAISDASALSQMQGLCNLYLSGTMIVDLSPLRSLVNLKKLYIAGTPVQDLSPLEPLQNLEVLNIYNAAINDVAPLAKLRNLRVLVCTEYKINSASLAKLRLDCPNLRVFSA